MMRYKLKTRKLRAFVGTWHFPAVFALAAFFAHDQARLASFIDRNFFSDSIKVDSAKKVIKIFRAIPSYYWKGVFKNFAFVCDVYGLPARAALCLLKKDPCFT